MEQYIQCIKADELVWNRRNRREPVYYRGRPRRIRGLYRHAYGDDFYLLHYKDWLKLMDFRVDRLMRWAVGGYYKWLYYCKASCKSHDSHTFRWMDTQLAGINY